MPFTVLLWGRESRCENVLFCAFGFSRYSLFIQFSLAPLFTFWVSGIFFHTNQDSIYVQRILIKINVLIPFEAWTAFQIWLMWEGIDLIWPNAIFIKGEEHPPVFSYTEQETISWRRFTVVLTVLLALGLFKSRESLFTFLSPKTWFLCQSQ